MMEEKVTKADLNYRLSSFVNVDEMQHVLKNKLDAIEFRFSIEKVSDRLNELQTDF